MNAPCLAREASNMFNRIFLLEIDRFNILGQKAGPGLMHSGEELKIGFQRSRIYRVNLS
jgi:hypothetical protein